MGLAAALSTLGVVAASADQPTASPTPVVEPTGSGGQPSESAADPPAGAASPDALPSEDLLREAVRLRGLALSDMEEGDCGRALPRLERIGEILPDNVLPPLNRGLCLTRLGRSEEASAALDRAAELAPANPRLLVARARLLEQVRGPDAAAGELERVLDDLARLHPHDVRPWALLARLRVRQERWDDAIPLLERALEEEPENVVLLGDLLVARAEAGDGAGVERALDALEDRYDGFEETLATFALDLRDAADDGALETLRPASRIFLNVLRPTELYRVHRVPIEGTGPAGGMFPQVDFDPPLPASIQGGQDPEIEWVDATGNLPAGLADGVLRGVSAPVPGTEALVIERAAGLEEWRLAGAAIERPSGSVQLSAPGAPFALRAFDPDPLPDLVTVTPAGELVLRPGLGDGAFGEARTLAAVGVVAGLEAHDLEPDGDLDLLVLRPGRPDLALRNPGEGAWVDVTGAHGLGGDVGSADLAVFDADSDGDLDLLRLAVDGPPQLLLDARSGALAAAGPGWGLEAVAPADRVELADLDADGAFDLVLWSAGGAVRLLRQVGNGSNFVGAELPAPPAVAAVVVADLDNDADGDLVVAPVGGGRLVWLRNRREEGWTAEPLGPELPEVGRLEAVDVDGDGDLDLVVGSRPAAAAAGTDDGEPRIRWLRNDGGNRNHWLRLALRGLWENNSKNNVEGLFARIEVRAGGRVQTTTGNGRVNHLGLGAERQVDVLRVVWTNGVPQTWQLLAADRTLVEEQVLKGSCPFLYLWDGEGFRFHTDLLWRSPLGMVLADGRDAPHVSGRDWVLIPGDRLRPVDGRVWMQVTEELWETAWIDRHELLAVDRPADVEVVVDEAFRPPPHPLDVPLHRVGDRRAPVAALDHRGVDVLDRVRAAEDGRRVDALPLGRYQGLTEGHHLDLRFEDVPPDEPLRLVLRGWIFPTDSTINRAVSQDPSVAPHGPRLHARRADGTWREVLPFVGFPAGKRKAVVVELPPGLVVAADGPDAGEIRSAGRLELRLETNLQIYWDQAELAIGEPEGVVRVHRLEAERADLHPRGFSRELREDPTGPHVFAWDDVTTGPRWRDMAGRFTRFGPVEELLRASDDRSVVMSAGDALTLRFDVSGLPPVPAGWRRDWVLHTDGWVKDADLNTRAPQTVEPHPHHGMAAYPDPGRPFPATAAHRGWLETYQTREVDDREFREALRAAAADR